MARFFYESFGSVRDLLARGLAFGVIRRSRLVSMAASLALSPRYCDVGAYTSPRYRCQGFATDCVEAIFAHTLTRDVRPLAHW
jgi:predicted GNAT family acetyltransferase